MVAGDAVVLHHGECGHGLTKDSSETSPVGEHRGPKINPRCTGDVLYACAPLIPSGARRAPLRSEVRMNLANFGMHQFFEVGMTI